jgi:putative transposase
MKPGTFTQLYVQLVFAVSNRDAVLKDAIKFKIFGYMSGIISGKKHKSIIINGVNDHVHLLIGLNPAVSISDTVHEVKRCSSLFINNEKLCPGRFSWQEGYGAFSYGRSQLDRVYRYIQNQDRHHLKQSFKEEYLEFLNKYEIEYNPNFLFEFFEDV